MKIKIKFGLLKEVTNFGLRQRVRVGRVGSCPLTNWQPENLKASSNLSFAVKEFPEAGHGSFGKT